ncbi:eCIS core domain-containing protein [Mucilaginibacter xinganensis]|uniref:eCIS core domain-containing protein n=1 Tax=Mucilaginibacter xinganensis TaxID=1234841 RepID=A0A223NWE7_9SPHI|nr:DUF4157 domain-containing protein [Mucilaginibacter xinganensis]ASU33918.1 hypothetical protein MuYL_2026 [Mucilaginibacter xinganensis]
MHEGTLIANKPQGSAAALAGNSTPVQQEREHVLNNRFAVQLKLSVGAANDPLEHEADAIAEKVMRMPDTSFIQRKAGCSCGGVDDERVHLKPLASDVTPFIQAKGEGAGTVSDAVSGKIKSSMGGGGQMQADTRSFMESRFGADFGNVKIHNNDEAAQLNRSLNAKAFTVSNNIYFNSGQYQPETDSGKHLLAHELTHVIQQNGPEGDNLQRKTHIQRQQTPQAPAFSVNQATYLGLVNRALGQMTGNLVNSETLAPVILPILQAMLTNVAWKDAAGAISGGGVTHYALPGGVTLNLQLILNDAPGSLLAGEFTHRGLTDGEMEIFILNNATDSEIAETMYHEAMHLVGWLINRIPPAIALRSTARGIGQAGGVGTLDQSRWPQALATIHLWLDTLATSVNTRRGATAQISPANVDTITHWLFDEVNVRIETEVFRLVQSTQQAITSRGPSIIIGTGSNWQINSTMLSHYIFDLSRVFLPGDRAGLTAIDQQTLAMLQQILEGLFQGRVSRRFSPSPYLAGRGIPRAPFQWSPPPLTPPTFSPLPVP